MELNENREAHNSAPGRDKGSPERKMDQKKAALEEARMLLVQARQQIEFGEDRGRSGSEDALDNAAVYAYPPIDEDHVEAELREDHAARSTGDRAHESPDEPSEGPNIEITEEVRQDCIAQDRD